MDLGDTRWRKSSYSGTQGNCVEVALPQWQKSSYSGTETECVEVAVAPTAVGIRDTKDRTGGALLVSPASWTAFLTAQR
ncbi:DUF397 domain-containing protein [Amycolatopsis sp. CA-230715]|uniref:DUF397 domain-containing protein n=1 Tax=Amycolatopsis sp. CA-230715 TaxID=2745196 RepID=UPI001C02C8BE|nr:DUF397 domain-containing protein [Amycolatopsis sp. CA-230715]QWF78385.1 hypothetical protein HUW46_01781 [Amycolatopsis sp. CA-230715]